MSTSLILVILLLIVSAVLLIFALAPKPKLDATVPQHQIPDLPLPALAQWLAKQEAATANIHPSTHARIQWADENKPAKTQLVFLYLHGFSASWQETAPLTEQLARQYSANIVQARVAGHGLSIDSQGMLTPAEAWLQSVIDQYELASRIGHKVVIVATSTGAALAIWLLKQPRIQTNVYCCLFMSPNFRIHNPFGFLLTWPWSKHWVHLILGKQYSWQPNSAAEAECWTWQYSTLALIEMQKTIDWVKGQSLQSINIPVAMMYMQNDPTVSATAIINAYHRWGCKDKQLVKVEIEPDAAEHVFVGNITAPQRVNWSTGQFIDFMQQLDTSQPDQ
ncbi:MAG: alpha/beta fold hydrolase [Pseudomonadales bacterium]|nr:alpha/beta fold hydrolase [Pseudomonadales bacterium]